MTNRILIYALAGGVAVLSWIAIAIRGSDGPSESLDALFGFGSPKVQSPDSSASSQSESVVLSKLAAAAGLSAQYLDRQNDANGKFVYRLNLDPSVKLKPRYNMLRHAGTIYALADYQQWRPNDDTRRTLKKSVHFLKKSLGPLPARADLLAIWSRPETGEINGPLRAKLGGASLALVALLNVEKVIPATTPLDDLRRLGAFLLYSQKPDGSFYSKYIPSQGGRSDKWASLYYPGEAVLGLLMLHEKDPQPQWLQAATRGLGYLALSRKGRSHVEADHWALLATARLLRMDQQTEPRTARRELLIAHAAQICESILSEQPHFPRRCLEHGCLTADGRTCASATRLEGLIAALTFLPDEHDPLAERIRRSVRQGIAFLLRCQVQSGVHVGAVPRAIRLLPYGHPFATAAFNRRATEVRIDYVQHAMSAMIAFHNLSSFQAN